MQVMAGGVHLKLWISLTLLPSPVFLGNRRQTPLMPLRKQGPTTNPAWTPLPLRREVREGSAGEGGVGRGTGRGWKRGDGREGEGVYLRGGEGKKSAKCVRNGKKEDHK